MEVCVRGPLIGRDPFRTGANTLPFGDRLAALPLAALWTIA
jgi:hypothetical protein